MNNNIFAEEYNNFTNSDTTKFLDKNKLCGNVETLISHKEHSNELEEIRRRATHLINYEANYVGKKSKANLHKLYADKIRIWGLVGKLPHNLSHKLISISIKGNDFNAEFMRYFFYKISKSHINRHINEKKLLEILKGGFTQKKLLNYVGNQDILLPHNSTYFTPNVQCFLDSDRYQINTHLTNLVKDKYFHKNERTYYLGDCSTVYYYLQNYISEIFDKLDNHHYHSEFNEVIEDTIYANTENLEKRNILYIDFDKYKAKLEDFKHYPYREVQNIREAIGLVGNSKLHNQYVNNGKTYTYYSHLCPDCNTEVKTNSNSVYNVPKCDCSGKNNRLKPIKKIDTAENLPTYALDKFHISPQFSVAFANLHSFDISDFIDLYKDKNKAKLVVLKSKLVSVSDAMTDYNGRTYYDLVFCENENYYDLKDRSPLCISAVYYAPDFEKGKLHDYFGEHLLICGVINHTYPNKRRDTKGKHFLDLVSIELDDTLNPKIVSEHIDKWYSEVKASPQIAFNKLCRSIEKLGIFGWRNLVECVALVYAHNTPKSRLHLTVIGDGGIGKSEISKVMTKIMPHMSKKADGEVSSDKLYGRCIQSKNGWYFHRGILSVNQRSVVWIDEADKISPHLKGFHSVLNDGETVLDKANETAKKVPCDNNVIFLCNPLHNSFRTDFREEEIDLSLQKPKNLTDTIINRSFGVLYLIKEDSKFRQASNLIDEFRNKGYVTNSQYADENTFTIEEIRSILLQSRNNTPSKYKGDIGAIHKLSDQLELTDGRQRSILFEVAKAVCQLFGYKSINEECYRLATDVMLRAKQTSKRVLKRGQLNAY